MNNKELTERVEDIKKKYIHYSTSIGDSNIFYMSEDDYRSFERELTDLLAKAILSNDEIKREAVEESMLLRLSSRVHAMFRDAIDPKSVSGYNEALDDVQDMIQEYLTQKENNE